MDGSGMLTSFFFWGGYVMQSGGRGLTFCFYIRGIADSQTLIRGEITRILEGNISDSNHWNVW